MFNMGKSLQEVESFKAKMNRHILKLIRDEQAADEIHNMNSFKSKKYFDIEYNLDTLLSRRKGQDYSLSSDPLLLASPAQAMLNKRT